MNIKKPLLIAGVASGVTFASLAGVNSASAAENTGSTTDPQSSLISKIATKFKLNQNEVKAVFEAERTEREATRQKEVETELTKLVSEGKITSAQKDAILTKRTELQKTREANRDAMKDSTDSDRKTKVEPERTALKTWASQNGISEDYLKYVLGGPKGPGGAGPRP